MRTLCSLSPDEVALLVVCVEGRMISDDNGLGDDDRSELAALYAKIEAIRVDLQEEHECEVITSDSEERGQDLDEDEQYLYDNTPDEDDWDHTDETIF